MENIDIGKKIEKQRKEKGLTSKELAKWPKSHHLCLVKLNVVLLTLPFKH